MISRCPKVRAEELIFESRAEELIASGHWAQVVHYATLALTIHLKFTIETDEFFPPILVQKNFE